MKHGLRAAICLTALAGLTAGCGENQTYTLEEPMKVAGEPAEEMLPVSPVTTGGPLPTQRPVGGAPIEIAQQQYIAYIYNYFLGLPARKVLSLYEQHLALCRAAAPTQCQIVQAETHNEADGTPSAKLSLRAAPQWLDSFRAQLSKDTSAANGQISQFQMTREDLSRSVIDTEAYLRAQTALRDRLQNLLASRPGQLKELLETERELARVQGKLDSAHSRLAHLRMRVAMSDVTINYDTDQSALAWQGRTAPNYFKNLWATTRDSFLGMVQFIAFILPWLFPASLVAWGLRRLWTARKKAKQETKAAETAAD